MRRQNYQLGDTVSKTTEDVTSWKAERGIVETGKNTLALPIKLNEQPRGYVFRGKGKLILDTIVETEKGAVGKPVERTIDEAFLMLGDSEETRRHLGTADKEDLAGLGFENEQGFISEAEDLLAKFVRGATCGCRGFGDSHGIIFAFPTENDELDILVAKDQKLIYKTIDMVFVSDKNKTVLRSPEEVVVSHNQKSVIIKRNCCRIHR